MVPSSASEVIKETSELLFHLGQYLSDSLGLEVVFFKSNLQCVNYVKHKWIEKKNSTNIKKQLTSKKLKSGLYKIEKNI